MRDDTWAYHSRASLEHKYLTIATPKVGCTTIKRALHAFEGLPPADPWWAVHDAAPGMRLSALSERDAQRLLAAPDVLRFAFVRNPYDRLLSAWKSKILRRQDTQYAPLRAEIRTAFRYPVSGDDSPIVPFGDFVRFVTERGHPDAHWSRQTDVLAYDTIDYEVLGRFESFREDFERILRRLSAPDDVLALAAEITNPTEDIPLAAAYDRAVADTVYEYFCADFDAFGYDRDSWLSP